MRYFKITNKGENHHGFQYVDGLNVLIEPFQFDGDCVKGGLYFTGIKHIFEFLNFGIYLREISLPTDDPGFRRVDLPNKSRANKIILGEKYDLSDVSTFEYLISIGADVKSHSCDIMRWAWKYRFVNILNYVATTFDIRLGPETSHVFRYARNAQNEWAKHQFKDIYNERIIPQCFYLLSEYGHLNAVKSIESILAINHVDYTKSIAIIHAMKNGHDHVIKYLCRSAKTFDESVLPEIKKYINDPDYAEKLFDLVEKIEFFKELENI